MPPVARRHSRPRPRGRVGVFLPPRHQPAPAAQKSKPDQPRVSAATNNSLSRLRVSRRALSALPTAPANARRLCRRAGTRAGVRVNPLILLAVGSKSPLIRAAGIALRAPASAYNAPAFIVARAKGSRALLFTPLAGEGENKRQLRHDTDQVGFCGVASCAGCVAWRSRRRTNSLLGVAWRVPRWRRSGSPRWNGAARRTREAPDFQGESIASWWTNGHNARPGSPGLLYAASRTSR